MGFGCLLGNGEKIRFWSDIWVNERSLKDCFPRMYALSNRKTGLVHEFGKWINHGWKWDISLRREVFDWEVYQWNEFMKVISTMVPNHARQDQLVWKFDSKGFFTVKSFGYALEHVRFSEERAERSIWMGLVPPKVEVFCWKMLKGRLPVKQVLARIGIEVGENALCVLCRERVEDVVHLFLLCKKVSSVWEECLNWWGISACIPNSLVNWWCQWRELCPSSSLSKAWSVCFFAIVWSIWLARNDCIFNEVTYNRPALLDIIKVRVIWWIQAKMDKINMSFSNLLYNFKLACEAYKVKKLPRAAQWSAPSLGVYKFNVDGSVIGKPGPGGVGGVLRDWNGKVKGMFSTSIGVVDSNFAELYAILQALEMIATCDELRTTSLIIESDSANSVLWVNSKESRCWKYVSTINRIHNLIRACPSVSVVKIFREANGFADTLARQGVHREFNFQAIF